MFILRDILPGLEQGLDPEVSSERKTVAINKSIAEIYKDVGAGSRGYNLVIPNGKVLALLNKPIADINQDPIIRQAFSTFKFTN